MESEPLHWPSGAFPPGRGGGAGGGEALEGGGKEEIVVQFHLGEEVEQEWGRLWRGGSGGWREEGDCVDEGRQCLQKAKRVRP